MDYLNQEFYRLNKDTPDLVYNFANERITYRKEFSDDGSIQIVEIRQLYGERETTKRIVSSFEMSADDFDYWKRKLTEEALEYQNKDARETRNNVNLDELSDTIYLCTESVEDEYIYNESLQKDLLIQEAAIKTYEQLTPIQKRRFYKAKVLGMSTYQIAKEEGVSNISVFESIIATEKKLRKALNKINQRKNE